MKKIFVGIVLGIIMTGIVYAAATAAKDISYHTDSNDEVKTVEDALNDLYNKKSVSDSKNIQSFTVNGQLQGTKINLSLNSNIVTNDDSKIVGYIGIINGKVFSISEVFPTQVDATVGVINKISIYAVNENYEIKKSNEVQVETPNIVITPLEYPLFTSNGVMNVKCVSPERTWYEYNESYDVTASDALPKAAYDGDESTYVDVSLKKYYFVFETGNDIWNFLFKTSSQIKLSGSGFTVQTGEATLLSNGYWHPTYWGKGKFIFKEDKKALIVKDTGRVYEMKYDSSI